MWILIITVLAAASLAPLAAPVEAVDLFTGPLAGNDLYCAAANKSGANLTMTLEIITLSGSPAVPGSQLAKCGPVVVQPKRSAVCPYSNAIVVNTAYCKITTSSGSSTRGILMVLGNLLIAVASSEAK
jgi:hypothetical protein